MSFFTTDKKRYSIDSLRELISQFAYSGTGFAKSLSSHTQHLGAEIVAGEISQLLNRSMSESDVNSLGNILHLVYFNTAYLPRRQGPVLCNALDELGIADILLTYFKGESPVALKDLIILMLKCERLFSKTAIDLVVDHILTKDFLMVQNLLPMTLRWPVLYSDVLTRIIDVKNPYLLWGLLEFQAEKLTGEINAFLPKIGEIEDPVVQRALKNYIEVKNLMTNTHAGVRSDESFESETDIGPQCEEFCFISFREYFFDVADTIDYNREDLDNVYRSFIAEQ